MIEFDLVRWSVNNLFVPMFRINATKQVVTTTRHVAGALGVTEGALRDMLSEHRDNFQLLSAGKSHAKEFLTANRALFAVLRVAAQRKTKHLRLV